MRCQIHRVLEPDLTRPFQFRTALLLQAPNLINRVIDNLYRMKFIEGDLGIR